MIRVRRRCYALRKIARSLLVLATWLLTQPASADDAQNDTAGLQSGVVFTDYSPLSSNAELVRRIFSPLDALRLNHEATRLGKDLRAQPIDLSHEKFVVYVPAHAASQDYSLLVFVPPSQRMQVPSQWVPVLNRHDMIFVSPTNSGNDANVLERRVPLALLAAKNIMRRYPVNPERVFIGGFSGGARVALRLALDYPDVFHGALLNAGSDPIGNAQLPVPASELFARFQDSSRLVYVTGAQDPLRLAEDLLSRQTMQEGCMLSVVSQVMPWKGHELADSRALNGALDALLEHRQPDSTRLADCRARVARGVEAQLQHVDDLFAGGRRAEARTLLGKIDARYGGLAAPRSIELAGK